MSGLLHKITDAITGHHTHTNTNTNTATTTDAAHTHTTGTTASTHNNKVDDKMMKDKSGAQVRDVPTDNLAGSGMNQPSGLASAAPAPTTTGTATGPQSHSAAYDSYNQSNNSIPSAPTATAAASTLGSSASSHLPASTTSSTSSSSLPSSHLGSTEQQHQRELNSTSTSSTSSPSVDNAMTLSEEHLIVGKEKVSAGKVSLNKYVTTETVGTAVPIMKERVVVEREPITDANRHLALNGQNFKESSHEVTLMEEKLTVQKEAVPVERVRLRKEQELSQQYVEAELRKEHVEFVDQTKAVGSKADAAVTGAEAGMAKLGVTEKQDQHEKGVGAGRQSEIDSTSATGRKL